MFRLHCQLDDGDYLSLMVDLNVYGQSRKKQRTLVRLFSAACLLLAACVIFLDKAVNVPAAAITVAFLAVVIVCLMTVCYKPLIRLSLRLTIWMLKRSGGVPYDKSADLVFEDDALIYNSGAMEAKTRYDAFKGVDVCKKAVYLRLDAMRVYIVPFAAFANDAERVRFLAFVAKRIAPNAAFNTKL